MDYTNLILSYLEIMHKGELIKDEPVSHFKVIAYKKAMNEIKNLNHPIFSYDDVSELTGVGARIKDKIKEIIETGKLKAAENIEKTYEIDDLIKVHGIGPVKARQLINIGIRNFEELSEAVKTSPSLLNRTQKLGMKYYHASLLRIPRAEMKEHEKILTKFIPDGLYGKMVGSYCRKSIDSGDIDLLITYGTEMSEAKAKQLFKVFIDTLTENGYVLDKLVSGQKKWMGYVSKSPRGKSRRLDLLLTPPSEYPYSLLYFTGSDKFNIAFRKYANSKGYTLNEHKMISLGESEVPDPPIMKNEYDIFSFLGLDYVRPKDRVDENQIIPLE